MVFGSLHDLATYYGQDYHGANSTTYTENLNLILIQPFYFIFDCKMIKLELLVRMSNMYMPWASNSVFNLLVAIAVNYVKNNWWCSLLILASEVKVFF